MAVKSQVVFIAGSTVDWNSFLRNIVDLTGRSPTKGIDHSGLKLSDYTRFISALGEFREEKLLNPLDTLRDADAVLRHLYLSFLISGSSALIFKISELTELNMMTANLVERKGRAALVSGNLKQWRDATVELSRISQTRKVGNTVLDFLFKLGLQSIFSSFNRQPRSNGMFLLESK